MYIYKRFRISKSVLTIVLIGLALVIWSNPGFAGKPTYKHDIPVVVTFWDRSTDPIDRIKSDAEYGGSDTYSDDDHGITAILGRRCGVFGLDTNTNKGKGKAGRTLHLDFTNQVDTGDFLLPDGFHDALPPRKALMKTSRSNNPDNRYQYDLRAMTAGSVISVPFLIEFCLAEPLTGTGADNTDNWYVSFGDVNNHDGGWYDNNINCSSGTPVTVRRLQGDDHDSGIWEIETPTDVSPDSKACLHSAGSSGDIQVKYYGDYDMPFGLTIMTLDLADTLAPPVSNLRSGLTSTWGRIKAER